MKAKLFCLPYAGGAAIIYNSWKQFLDSEIALKPVELAGRGRRINESFYKNRSEAVEDVFKLIKNDISEAPYLLFGHSMGTLITYELVQKIREHQLPGPLHVFFSGSSAPHLKDDNKKYHLMSEADFKEEVLQLGGTPREFFENPELLDVFLPVLKNDFRLSETDLHTGEINPLDESITVFLGREDELTQQQCEEWRRHTKERCALHYFDGGHFFLHEETEKIVKIINETYLHSMYSQSLNHQRV